MERLTAILKNCVKVIDCTWLLACIVALFFPVPKFMSLLRYLYSIKESVISEGHPFNSFHFANLVMYLTNNLSSL